MSRRKLSTAQWKGVRFRKAMAFLGLESKQVEAICNVNQSTVSRWKSGLIEISDNALDCLHEKYGLNPNFVITGKGPIKINN